MAEKVKFIRKNGKVIPIKVKHQKGIEKQSKGYKQLATGAAAGSFGSTLFQKRDGVKAVRTHKGVRYAAAFKPTKISKAFKFGGIGLGLAGYYNIFKGRSEQDPGKRKGLIRTGATALGTEIFAGLAGGIAGGATIVGMSRLAKVMKAKRAASRTGF